MLNTTPDPHNKWTKKRARSQVGRLSTMSGRARRHRGGRVRITVAVVSSVVVGWFLGRVDDRLGELA
jgi:hypothetical protein